MNVHELRRNKLRQLIRRAKLDALLVTNFTNVTYLTGFSGDDSYLLVSGDSQLLLTDPRYTGRVTVPALWDRRQRRIVNNESAEILRMLNSAFDELTGNRLDFYPDDLRDVIDEVLVAARFTTELCEDLARAKAAQVA